MKRLLAGLVLALSLSSCTPPSHWWIGHSASICREDQPCWRAWMGNGMVGPHLGPRDHPVLFSGSRQVPCGEPWDDAQFTCWVRP